jgi:hypothetical protein
MKHTGFLKKSNAKVIVVYKTIPNDSANCLVIDRDALRPFEADQIIPALESKDGQDAFDFGDLLARKKMPIDAMVDQAGEEVGQSVQGVTVLAYLHQKGMLIKQPTYNVVMTPGANVTITLDELNMEIANQRGTSVNDLALKDPTRLPDDSQEKTDAQNMLSRADRLQAQVDELKERAYKLDESLRPKKGRPKKASTKEQVEA